jgi:hypothetical protein
VIEAATCLLRFSLQWEATRDTGFLGGWTFGLRIHHCYLGMVLVIVGAVFARGLALNWTLVFGTAVVLSDLVHHFAILWPLTGEPQFDLFYP